MNRRLDRNHPARAVVLHGAGYVGRELIGVLLRHEGVQLTHVTSSTFAGEPLHAGHPGLRGVSDLTFSAEWPERSAAGSGASGGGVAGSGVDAADVVFVTAGHGQSAEAVGRVRDAGYEGLVVDLSADCRYPDVSSYETWIGASHTRPDLLTGALYSLPEITGDLPSDARLVANPGCFATALALALWPLSQHVPAGAAVAVTALTGASGSGARPSAGTHFPDRDGNVRAYKVLAHQHAAEISQLFPDAFRFSFVPVSGPWTRGIWGTAQVDLTGGGPAERSPVHSDAALLEEVSAWFRAAYGSAPLVRLSSPGTLPDMLPVVGTPFADIGWIVKNGTLVVGFAIDNLLKGAASQAIQNMNLAFGWPVGAGLLPSHLPEYA